jgi:hypothetical protein
MHAVRGFEVLMAVISPGETAEVVERAGDEFLPARVLSFGGGGKKLNEVPRTRCRLSARRRWGREETIL